MLFLLSLSFLGYGITELQEVGMVSTTLILSIPRVEILGLYPTMETSLPQMILLLCLTYSVYLSFFKKTA